MPTILKKLRLKFMAMTTGIVAVLVAVIAGAYCFSVYNSASTEIDIALDHAVNASQGGGPDHQQPLEGEFKGEGNPPVDSGKGEQAGNEEQNATELDPDQRIDLFKGRSALVYSIVVDLQGTVLLNNSPAIGISDSVLESAISTILSSSDLSSGHTAEIAGKLTDEGLFYLAKVENDTVHIGLTDSTALDTTLHNAIFGSLALAALALALTIVVSFFLARLFLRPVEDAWTKQRRFIADASHELKTPLTVIMANTEIVRSEPDTLVASQMKWLDGTMDESERMHGLIADLLLLARMDDDQANTGPGAEEAIDLSQAVENSIVSFEAIAFERNLTIEDSITEDLRVKAVPSRLTRLPDILIDNACKYAEAGGVIKVNLSEQGGQAVLHVFNTGPEIAASDKEHLFDRFYRADESRCDDIPGYGLGLSIAHSIVEESGGAIDVQNVSEEGGVAFTVTLPRAL